VRSLGEVCLWPRSARLEWWAKAMDELSEHLGHDHSSPLVALKAHRRFKHIADYFEEQQDSLLL